MARAGLGKEKEAAPVPEGGLSLRPNGPRGSGSRGERREDVAFPEAGDNHSTAAEKGSAEPGTCQLGALSNALLCQLNCGVLMGVVHTHGFCRFDTCCKQNRQGRCDPKSLFAKAASGRATLAPDLCCVGTCLVFHESLLYPRETLQVDYCDTLARNGQARSWNFF